MELFPQVGEPLARVLLEQRVVVLIFSKRHVELSDEIFVVLRLRPIEERRGRDGADQAG